MSNGWQAGDVDEAFSGISNFQPIGSSHKGVWIIASILLVLIGGAVSIFAAYSYGFFSAPSMATSGTPPSSATTSVMNTSATQTAPVQSDANLPANEPAAIPAAAVNPVRSLAYDNAIKSDLGTIQLEAETYYYGSFPPGPVKAGANSYGVPGESCNTVGSVFVDPTIAAAISHAQDQNGGALGYGGTPLACNNSATAYAVSSRLFSARTEGKPDYWCVDSTGISSESTTPLGSATVCPTQN